MLCACGAANARRGRHSDAIELFDAARVALPKSYRRDHGRYAANVALAAALDEQRDRAASAAREALTRTLETGSAHAFDELRRATNKWPKAPVVAEFDRMLRAALTAHA